MDATKIKELCALGENSTVQFKLRLDQPNKIAAEIVAFANYHGGTILVGVEDKTGKIEGLNYEEIQHTSSQIGNAANDYVRPTIYIQTETVLVDGKAVLAVHVNEGINKPYKDASGNIWVKQGSDKRRIVENDEILAMFQESGRYHADEHGVDRTSLTDVDMYALNDYLEQSYGKSADSFGMPIDQLLKNLQIMTDDGRLTLAGLLFFGKRPQMYEPSFVIKAVSFYGNDMGVLEYRNSKDITGTIPRMFEMGMDFLTGNLHSLQAGQSFNSVGKLEISEVALKELLQNALVHRDYLIDAPIRIMIFDNRVEIVSPGGLPKGVDLESIRFGKTQQRNRLMATLCAKTMDYRGLGTGIIRATKEVPGIQFFNEENSQFKVVIRRPIDDYEPTSYVASEPSIRREDEYRHGIHVGNSGIMWPDLRLRCPDLPKGEDDTARKLLTYCKTVPQGILEMMEHTGYKSRTSFRRRLFTPLYEAGLLIPEYPDSPNSPKQRYRSVY